MEDSVNYNHLDSLSTELIFHTISELPVRDFLKFTSTCRNYFISLGNINLIWNSFLVRDFDVRPVESGAREKYKMLTDMKRMDLELTEKPTRIQHIIMDAVESISDHNMRDRAFIIPRKRGSSTAILFSIGDRALRIPESISYVLCSGMTMGSRFIRSIRDMFPSIVISMTMDVLKLLNGSEIRVLSCGITEEALLEKLDDRKTITVVDSLSLDWVIDNLDEMKRCADRLKKIGLVIISGNQIGETKEVSFSSWLKSLKLRPPQPPNFDDFSVTG